MKYVSERERKHKGWVTLRKSTVNWLNCAQRYYCDLSESINFITAGALWEGRCDSGEVVPAWGASSQVFLHHLLHKELHIAGLGKTDSKTMGLFPSVSCTKNIPMLYDGNFNLNAIIYIIPRTQFLLLYAAGWWYSALREMRDTFLSLKVSFTA